MSSARNETWHSLQKKRRDEAEKGEAAARQEAEKDRDAAQKAKEEEEIARKEEEKARAEAEQRREQAVVAQQNEAAAKKAEEYEAYVAEIGLANAKINDNAYDFAKQLLQQSNPGLRNWEWGRLAHLTELDSATHDAAGPVHAVAYSHDGKLIASGDMAGRVTVRDAHSGAVRWEARHEPFVLAVAFSPDDSKIASGGSDRKIQILDAANGNVLSTLEGHTDGVLSVRFSPDGTQLLSGSYDNTARLWDVASGDTLQELERHSWWVWAAEFSPDATKIVTAGQDGKAVVWIKQGTTPLPLGEVARNRAGEGLALRNANPSPLDNSLPLPKGEATEARPQPLYAYRTEFSRHNGAVYTARFSPKGDLVATGGADNLVMVWNPDDAQPVNIEQRLDGAPDPKANHLQMAGHDKPVRSVAFSPNGQLLASGSDDNTIRVWDTASGKPLRALRGHGNAVRSIEFSPDGQWVLSGGEDQKVRVWDVHGYEETRLLHATLLAGHVDAVLSARFSRDGRQIITASRDRTASLWDAATGTQLKLFEEGHEFLVSGAAFFGNETAGGGPARLATGAVDNSVRIWDMAAGTAVSFSVAHRARRHAGRLARRQMGCHGRTRSRARVWNADNGELAATLRGPCCGSVGPGVFAKRRSAGNWRRSRTGAGLAKLEQEAEWALENELKGHNGTITAIRFTPDGQRLITASGDRTGGQFDLSSGQELRDVVLKHPEWVSSLDLSADGTQALTTCDDGVARLWRLADATVLASVKAPGKPFKANDISPDGSTALLTSSEDKQVLLWDLSAASAGFGAQDANPQPPAPSPLPLHLRPFLNFNQLGGEVWSAMFAPDGRHVLTIGGNDARLWNLDSRTPVVRYSPHGAVASAALSPDGRLVATGSWDTSAKIWDAESGRAIRKLEGGHTKFVNAVEFSPDGSELLTASDDGTARLWDVETGKPTDIVFRGHTSRVTAATFSHRRSASAHGQRRQDGPRLGTSDR